MNLIPTWPIAAGALIVGLIAGAGGMHVWKAGTIADLKVDIANLKKDQANAVAQQSQIALSDLAEASKKIKETAQSSQVDITQLNAKLEVIRRNQNAKPPPPPLPVDCKPGTERVRRLSESAAAVDEAITRSISGK